MGSLERPGRRAGGRGISSNRCIQIDEEPKFNGAVRETSTTGPGEVTRRTPLPPGRQTAAIDGWQKFDVKIIDRQSNSGSYRYVVPGYSNSTSNANVNCTGSNN